jgi:hypothetical protein
MMKPITGHFEFCCEALIAKAAERGCSLKCAQDLIDSGILTRGYYDHASKPQIIAGFASGGDTGRRAFSPGNFMDAVEAYAAARHKPKAAA